MSTKKRKNWWELDQDPGYDSDKTAPRLPGMPEPYRTPPTFPGQPMPGVQPAPPLQPGVQVAVPTQPGAIPPTGGLPPITPEYDAAQKKYQAEMARGPHKQGAASQILFQVAEAMSNFGRGMQGQPMNEFRWLGEVKDERRNAQATREFAPHEQERQRQIQAAMQGRQMQKAASDAQVAQLEAVRKSNPVLAQQIEEMVKRGQPIPKEITDQLPKVGLGVAIPGVDNRELEYETRGDKTFSRPKGSRGEWGEEKQLTDPTKTPIQRELSTGEKFYTTGDKEADREATKSLNEAQLALRAGEINQREMDDYQRQLQGWQDDSLKTTEKKTQLLGEATTNETDAVSKREQAKFKSIRAEQIQEDDPKGAANLRDEADKLMVEARSHDAKAAAARKSADAVKTRPAPKFSGKKVTAPSLTTGTKAPKTVSQSQLQQLSKQSGKSVEELKKMAEAEGYRIQ